MKHKNDIRAHFLRLRNDISESDRQQAALKVVDILSTHPAFATSMHIACYLAHKKEFETMPIIETLWRLGKKCYLPVLCEGKTLAFVQYEQGDELTANQYSIPEPKNFAKKIPSEKLDMIIMPLVAFDHYGRRLGMGGGFYDRSLAFTHLKQDKPQRVGLAFSLQQCEELPEDPWDVNLNSVITEKGIIVI